MVLWLQALESNTTVRLLDLSGCQVIVLNVPHKHDRIANLHAVAKPMATSKSDGAAFACSTRQQVSHDAQCLKLYDVPRLPADDSCHRTACNWRPRSIPVVVSHPHCACTMCGTPTPHNLPAVLQR